MKSLFNTRLLGGETGRITRWARNRRSNARRFFSRSSPFYYYFFGLFCLVFSSFFLFFFSKIKSCPSNFIYVFFLRWWISNYHLQSGFKDNRTINEKNTCFSKFIYPKYYYYTIGCNFFPHFSIRIFPSASVIRKYPIRVLQTPVSRGVN